MDEQRLAQLRRQGFQPGIVTNPKGGKPGPKPDALTYLLREHFDEIVEREVPDGSGNPVMVKLSRLQLLVKMLAGMCFSKDVSSRLRCKALDVVLDRIDPVVKDETIKQIELIVRRPAGLQFAETLQQGALETGTLAPPEIIDALRTVKPDLDFNGVSNGNGGNGNQPPRIPADDPPSV